MNVTCATNQQPAGVFLTVKNAALVDIYAYRSETHIQQPSYACCVTSQGQRTVHYNAYLVFHYTSTGYSYVYPYILKLKTWIESLIQTTSSKKREKLNKSVEQPLRSDGAHRISEIGNNENLQNQFFQIGCQSLHQGLCWQKSSALQCECVSERVEARPRIAFIQHSQTVPAAYSVVFHGNK